MKINLKNIVYFQFRLEQILRMVTKGNTKAFVIADEEKQEVELWVYRNSEDSKIVKILFSFGKILRFEFLTLQTVMFEFLNLQTVMCEF